MALIDDKGGSEPLSVIHINVPKAVKAQWVRASQSQGLKLTDWIIKQLESTMSQTYTATIAHHSISRARSIEVNGTLAAAKAAATKEFGKDQIDYRIVITDQGGQTVAARRIGDSQWDNY